MPGAPKAWPAPPTPPKPAAPAFQLAPAGRESQQSKRHSHKQHQQGSPSQSSSQNVSGRRWYRARPSVQMLAQNAPPTITVHSERIQGDARRHAQVTTLRPTGTERETLANAARQGGTRTFRRGMLPMHAPTAGYPRGKRAQRVKAQVRIAR